MKRIDKTQFFAGVAVLVITLALGIGFLGSNMLLFRMLIALAWAMH